MAADEGCGVDEADRRGEMKRIWDVIWTPMIRGGFEGVLDEFR